MPQKKFLADITLVSSVIKDENGQQISLTKDERLGISNATGGPTSQSNPVVTKVYFDNEMNSLRAGLRWRDPVDTIANTAPTTTPTVGMRYLNLTDSKIYNCTVGGTWDKVETPEANWALFARDTDEEWTYDADTPKWVMKSSGSIPYATESMPGKVTFATNGEFASAKAVQANDKRLMLGSFATKLTSPTFPATVAHNLGTQKIMIQAWAQGSPVDVEISMDGTDPNNKINVSANGTPTSLDICIIAIP